MTSVSGPARAALLCAGLVALAAAPAHADGVSWLSDYNTARTAAHDKKLPLFIDFSTENCTWCRKLEEVTFRDPAVARLLSGQFVALHIHVAAAGGKEAALADKLNISRYPTLVFADSEGHILAKQDGYLEPAEFLQQAQHILAGLQAGDGGVQQAAHSATPAAGDDGDRARRASQLLALARADYREQRFLGCLERCKTLKADYADRPEAAEAIRLETQIRNDPEELRLACDNLTDRLGEMYLDLADAFLRKDQPARAILCLEWVVQACPGTPQAETAKERLAKVKSPVARQPDH